jgi:hypothetical protein
MSISRSTFPSQLREGIKINFGEGYKTPDSILDVFDKETSMKDVERYQEIGGFGLHQQKPEGTNTPFADVAEGPTTYIQNLSFALGYEITHEALSDTQYPKILKKATELGVSSSQTRETVVIDRLNTAFSLAPADLLANGQAMCSLTQPLSNTGGVTVQNRPTIAASLSEASLTLDVENIRNFLDPAAKKMDARPKTLIVPVSLEVRAWKLMNTTLSVGNNNNDLNPMNKQTGAGFFPGGVRKSVFLENPNAYYVRTDVPGLVYQVREASRIMEDVEVRALTQQVISYSRYNRGCYDFRSIYGNPGE